MAARYKRRQIMQCQQKEVYSDKVEVVVMLAVTCFIALTNPPPISYCPLSKRKHLVVPIARGN